MTPERDFFQKGSTAIWYISLRKRYQSRCPNSFVQERTTKKCILKWRSRRGKVNDWGQKVFESRSQGQRGRRRGLLFFFHFTLIGMGGISVYYIYPFLSYWSMVCHEMFARRIIHGEDKIPPTERSSRMLGMEAHLNLTSSFTLSVPFICIQSYTSGHFSLSKQIW